MIIDERLNKQGGIDMGIFGKNKETEPLLVDHDDWDSGNDFIDDDYRSNDTRSAKLFLESEMSDFLNIYEDDMGFLVTDRMYDVVESIFNFSEKSWNNYTYESSGMDELIKEVFKEDKTLFVFLSDYNLTEEVFYQFLKNNDGYLEFAKSRSKL